MLHRDSFVKFHLKKKDVKNKRKLMASLFVDIGPLIQPVFFSFFLFQLVVFTVVLLLLLLVIVKDQAIVKSCK